MKDLILKLELKSPRGRTEFALFGKSERGGCRAVLADEERISSSNGFMDETMRWLSKRTQDHEVVDVMRNGLPRITPARFHPDDHDGPDHVRPIQDVA